MHYHCLCEDGPAQGREFWDYGPPVRVGLPHEGQILDYRLISKLENRYIYHYHAGSAEDLAKDCPGHQDGSRPIHAGLSSPPRPA